MSRASEEMHKVINDPDLEGAPILVLANKQDIEGALTPEQVQGEMKLGELS